MDNAPEEGGKFAILYIEGVSKNIMILLVFPDLPTFPLLPEHYPSEVFNKIALLNESQIQ